MSPVRSYGPPSSRVLLAGEGPAEPELPNIMADPPMYYSEELEDDTSKKRWAKSSMSKRLSASLKRSLQNLPLFPKKKVADEEPPRRQGKLHAGPMSPKSLKPPEELKHGHGMHLVMERGESKSHSPSTYSRAIRPPSKEAPTVPSPRTSPSKESTSPTRFIPSKDASAMQLSIAPPSPTRTVRERKPTTPMSPSKPSAANKNCKGFRSEALILDYLFLNDGYVFMITCYSVFKILWFFFACVYIYTLIHNVHCFSFLLQFVDLRFTALFLML